MKYRFTFLPLMILLGICGCITRYWNLTYGFDAIGLPIPGHISIIALAAVSIASILIFLLLAIYAPGRSRMREALRYPLSLRIMSAAGAAIILLGGFAEFLMQPTTAGLVSALLLMAAAIGLLIAVLRYRSFPVVSPIPEIIAIVCLIIRLIICFKGWSTDPIISDYCIRLFQLIFVLIAVYQAAAFQFDLGKPRRTLFFTAGAFYFSFALIADGIVLQDYAAVITAVGLLLWFFTPAFCLLKPSQEVPIPKDKTA